MSDNIKKLKEKQAKLISQLAEVCEALNWLIVLPKEDMTSGLIIGNKEYVEKAAKRVYGHRYEIVNPKSKKTTIEAPPTLSEELDEQIVELTEEQYEQFMETGELPEDIIIPNKSTEYYH